MAATSPSAKVLNIQLTEFYYNTDHDLPDAGKITLKTSVLNRALPGKPLFDVLIKVAYLDNTGEDATPVLSASCLTTYILQDIPVEPDEDGDDSVSIPEVLMNLLKIEAIAHARAHIAIQAANTPFSSTYLELSTRFIDRILQLKLEDAE